MAAMLGCNHTRINLDMQKAENHFAKIELLFQLGKK